MSDSRVSLSGEFELLFAKNMGESVGLSKVDSFTTFSVSGVYYY